MHGTSAERAPPVRAGTHRTDEETHHDGCPSTAAHRGRRGPHHGAGHHGRRALRRAAGRGGGARQRCPQGPVHAPAGRGRRGTGARERSGGARGAAPLHGARDGAGGAGAASGRQAGHRPVHHGRLLLRLRRRGAVHPRGPQAAREVDAEDRQQEPDLPPPHGHGGRGARGDGRRALQARAHRPSRRAGLRCRGGVRRRCVRGGGRWRAHGLRQRGPQERGRGVARPLPRPAPAGHQAHRQRLRAHALRRGVLARQPGEPAAAADLRHGLALQGRAEGLQGASGRGRAPRPPQAGRGAGPLLLPGRAGLRPARVPPQGRDHPQGDGGLLARAPRPRRVRVRLHPAHHQGPPVRGLRTPGLVPGRDVPPDARGRGAGPGDG